MNKKLGINRAQKGSYLFQSLLRSNVELVFGSDWPVVDINPLGGIITAMKRIPPGWDIAWAPAESVSLNDSLKAYTLSAARACFLDGELGSLSPGKLADFVVLSIYTWDDFVAEGSASINATYVGERMSSWIGASSSPWLLRTSSSSCPSKFFKYQPCPPPPFRLLCLAQSNHVDSHFNFVLHDALDSSGILTSHARDAREGFCSQIRQMSDIERQTSISINRRVDLGRTSLYIAAEDDSLVSHSSVPLPVEAFISRFDDLSMDYCSHYNSSYKSSPERLLESLENYLYIHKGFRRTNARHLFETRALYLHSVLTHRSGSTAMLSLIYSEILKMLRLWGLLDFDVELFFPHDTHSLPRGYPKKKSKESDHAHIMTSQALLVEILRNLKEAFWPFQHDQSGNLFLRAARAANFIDAPNVDEDSGFRLASAKAAKHRLDRGVWTSVNFGDMRRALSACERLILLEVDSKELRDYSILLYHCGFYEQSLEFVKLYQDTKTRPQLRRSSNSSTDLEEDAVEKLMIRLKLILMEDGWSRPSYVRNFLGNSSDPW